MRFPVVLFDLDGTLIDSIGIILSSFRHATRTVLKRDVPDEELLAVVGLGLRTEMELLGGERAEELIRAYREHNEGLHEELEPCPGVLDALAALKEEGRRLGIVTSKRRASVELAFRRLPPLEPFFEVVVTVEDTERHKPSPDPILCALERMAARPDEAAYVGDSSFDVAAARAAGVHSVAVTWGGLHSLERILAEGPDAVVHDAEELHDVL